MANHLRRQIREAVGTKLTGLTTTGSRVYQSRVYPVQNTELPCLLVFARSESVEAESVHAPRVLSRLLQIEVDAVTKATADLDDTLDQICKEVEIALAPPVSGGLMNLVEDIVLRSTDIELSGSAEKPTGVARMVFEVSYYHLDSTPDVAQ
ncbi:MAG: hypothetical protein IT516_12445 [Burkholderiales bacterium]|nr:hypothetical protein [Burkholderiales bacterium]